MSGINSLDAYIIGLLLISVLIGIYRGFFREFFTIITLIIASTLAYIYGKDVGEMFAFIDSDIFRQLCGTLSVFIALFILGFIVKLIICKVCKIGSPSTFDRVTGAVFGLLRGLAIVIAVLLMVTDVIKAQDWYKKSSLIPYLSIVADNVVKITPESWKKKIQQEMQSINQEEMNLLQKYIQKKENVPVESLENNK